MSFSNKIFKRNVLSASVLIATMQVPSIALAQNNGSQKANNQSDMLEEVVVTGIRQSMKRSMDVKRNAGSVVDAITATDIGKLPDATIADSLQRITGIQISRSGGEG